MWLVQALALLASYPLVPRLTVENCEHRPESFGS
jgi:hypothetical protein